MSYSTMQLLYCANDVIILMVCALKIMSDRYPFICNSDSDYDVQSKRYEQISSSLDIGISADLTKMLHQKRFI